MTNSLTFHVHVSDPTPEHGTPPVPHGYPAVASPISSTLITGARTAALVDPPWTHDHVKVIGDWIASFDRELTAIYITHWHGDHWFGTADLLKRFPNARVYATAATIDGIRRQHEFREIMWDARFPGQVARGEIDVTAIPAEGIELERHTLRALELGHTDTDDTTALWAPSIGLIVAGDAVYNHCHQYFNESGNGGLDKWLQALDLIDRLQPRHVVAGHKDKTKLDDTGAIQRTRDYITTFAALLEQQPDTREEFFDLMLERFPGYANPKALWRSIVALTPQQ
jgi:glyoxylase-like metal-dependent hydrolase (beta-lactamase superfamily II)